MACQIIRISNIAGNCGKLVKGSYVIGSVLEDNVERYLINGEDFDLKQFGVDLFTIGFEMFAMKGAWSDLKVAQTLPKCFIAGTLVTMADGEKPIEEVEVGDEVLSMDYETGEVAVKKVTQTFVNETEELVHVNVKGEEIVATPSHPFYVAKFGWTLAADLRAGDVLVLSNGEYVTVEFVQHEILENPVKVYNFEVEDYHTYFVGESSVLVHNECMGNWAEGGRGSAEENSFYHYEKHGAEVGAKDYDDYLRKSKNYANTVLNKKIKVSYVDGITDNTFRYRYNGKYIDLSFNGQEHLIVSFGVNRLRY